MKLQKTTMHAFSMMALSVKGSGPRSLYNIVLYTVCHQPSLPPSLTHADNTPRIPAHQDCAVSDRVHGRSSSHLLCLPGLRLGLSPPDLGTLYGSRCLYRGRNNLWRTDHLHLLYRNILSRSEHRVPVDVVSACRHRHPVLPRAHLRPGHRRHSSRHHCWAHLSLDPEVVLHAGDCGAR